MALWLGGVERIKSVGINQLGVIHRGFSSYKTLNYRNKPKWHIAIELKKEFPNLPLILDPSHICGRRDTILDVSQTALDLNYDGFMIETHITPDDAWSDAKQQITPSRLKEIIEDLVIRKQSSSKETFQQKLNIYRDDLDKLDNHLLAILKSRMDISEQIGLLKRTENVAILQSARWEEILKSMHNEAKKKGLNQEFITEIFKACLLYTSPSPRDRTRSRMPSSA